MYFEIYEETRKNDVVFGEQQRTGRWRWRARARNGNILADSGQGYKGGRSKVLWALKMFVQHIRGHKHPGLIKVKDLSCGEELMI